MLSPEFLPARSIEEQLAGQVPVRLDGRTFVLPVLSRRENRVWKASMNAKLEGLFQSMTDESTAGQVMETLMTGDEAIVALVREYDRDNLIPPDEELERDTEAEWLSAFLLCVAASHPFVGLVLSGEPTPETARSQTPTNGHEPTSSPRPSTPGPRGSSKKK